MDTTITSTATAPVADSATPHADGHDWAIAGEAWGSRARDWATLFESYAVDMISTIHRSIGVGPGTTLLDVACGSGMAIRMAESAGANTAGVDAAAPLVEIAQIRNPRSDLRVGTMFELPWGDGSFDAVTAINGIWGNCQGAVDEAFRVLRPGGSIGLSFWGNGKPFDLKGAFIAFAIHSPKDHVAGMIKTNDVATPGVVEDMLETGGFVDVERGGLITMIEWPDPETAWRALSSVGPAQPALEAVGADVLRTAVLEALSVCRDDDGIYRLRNDHQFVTARHP